MNLKHIKLLSSISKLNEKLKLNQLDLVTSILSIYDIDLINKVAPKIESEIKSYTDICQRESYIMSSIAVILLDYPLGRQTVLLEAGSAYRSKCYDLSFVKSLFAKYNHFELMILLERFTPEEKTLHYKFYVPLQGATK